MPMCKRNLRISGGSLPLFALILTFCFQFILVSSSSAQAIACNDNVQVSLDDNCEAEITPEMILEGEDPGLVPADWTVTIDGTTGQTVTVTAKGTYTVTATHVPSGNSCWGTITVEDKLKPVITGVNSCPNGGTLFTTSFVGSVDGTNTLGTFGVTCAALGASVGLPNAVLPSDVAYELVPFTAPADGNYTLTPALPVGCDYVFGVIPAGTFNPADPCAGFVALGGASATFGSTSVGTAFLTAGEYELAICVNPFTCGYDITLTSDICEYPCNKIDEVTAAPWPAVDENCSSYDCVYSDVTVSDQCAGTITTRTWICTDECGNASDPWSQSLYFAPIDLAEVVAPVSSVDLNCGVGTTPQDIYDFQLPLVGSATAYTMAWPTVNGWPVDGAICNLAVTYTDQEIPLCGDGCGGDDNVKVIRTWNVFDWCDNSSISFVQIIKAADTEAPTLDVDDVTVSTDPWGCTASTYLPAPNILHDNCSFDVDYTVTGPVGVLITYNSSLGQYFVDDAPKGVHTFTYTATDCCGNSSSFDITVSVVDNAAPVAVAKQDIVISLTSSGSSGEGLGKLYAASIDNGSHDGCSPVHLEVRRESQNCGITGNTTYNNDGHSFDSGSDPDDGAFVKFCCDDIYGLNGVDEDGDGVNDYAVVQVWLRVWDDGDMNGVYGSAGDNFNETWANVRIEDKLAPVISCPPNIVVDCDTDCEDLNIVGQATAYGTCGASNVDYTDINTVNSCGVGTIYRRWFVVGRPDVFCTQVIDKTALNPFDGDDINWPGDITVDCMQPSPSEPTWNPGPCDLIGYSVESDTFLFEDGACFKILNHYTVIDWCQYDPNDTDLNTVYDPTDDGYVFGIWFHTQVVKVEDNIAPTLFECDDLMMEVNDHNDADGDGIECENRAVMLTNTAEDNGDCASDWLKWDIEIDLWGDGSVDYILSAVSASGEQVKVTIPEDIEGSMYNHRVLWKVRDGCGNTTSCSTTFMVVDKKAPTPYCVNLSTALMENGQVALWACDFDLGSFDNCSEQEDLRFTFSKTHPDLDPDYVPSLKCSAKVFDCDDLPEEGNTIEVEVYVWDEKDNYDYCTVNLTLIDNQGGCGETQSAQIAGNVTTENGVNVEGVEMTLQSILPEFPKTDMTDTDGHYGFASNPMYVDYNVGGQKNDDYMNGVSTLDLVLIQKHILNLQPLASPYKVIAADVNGDTNVSAIDLIELRKLILGIYTELPSNDSWRFADASQVFGNPSDPFPFVEVINLNNLISDQMNETFVAIKIGDVNGSATANVNAEAVENRSNQSLDFVINDMEVTAGQEITVPVYANNFTKVVGYQYTINLSDARFVDFGKEALNMNASNFGMIADNQITTSWNASNGVSANENDALFTLTLVAEKAGQLSDMIQFGSTVTRAEAYDINGVVADVTLNFRSGDELIAGGTFELFQNQPNPFKGQTIVGFTLPEAGSATLTIFDVTGKQLNVIRGNYAKGYNSVVLTKDDLKASGVLYYQLESGTNIATRKMIEIE